VIFPSPLFSQKGSEANTHKPQTPNTQLQQELLSARHKIESQATQILALKEVFQVRPELCPDAPENEKDRLIAEQARNICKLVKGYEDNLDDGGERNRSTEWGRGTEWKWRGEREMCASVL
jgi:centromeric protein E